MCTEDKANLCRTDIIVIMPHEHHHVIHLTAEGKTHHYRLSRGLYSTYIRPESEIHTVYMSRTPLHHNQGVKYSTYIRPGSELHCIYHKYVQNTAIPWPEVCTVPISGKRVKYIQYIFLKHCYTMTRDLYIVVSSLKHISRRYRGGHHERYRDTIVYISNLNKCHLNTWRPYICTGKLVYICLLVLFCHLTQNLRHRSWKKKSKFNRKQSLFTQQRPQQP